MAKWNFGLMESFLLLEMGWMVGLSVLFLLSLFMTGKKKIERKENNQFIGDLLLRSASIVVWKGKFKKHREGVAA